MGAQLQWMLIPKFCEYTGYSEKAVQRKIEEGIWNDRNLVRRSPDGHRQVNLQMFYRWVEEGK